MLLTVLLSLVLGAVVYRVIYAEFFHPLARFHGPWYMRWSSVMLAIISVCGWEAEFMLGLVRQYGSEKPIRISPDAILFPRASALKDIYWDSRSNTKGAFYGRGAFGISNVITTEDGEDHRVIRKAVSGGPWTIGPLKRHWEGRVDELVKCFMEKMAGHAEAKREVVFNAKFGEFALDVMSLVSFSEPFGCVKRQEDTRHILDNWRQGLYFTGILTKFRFIRDVVFKTPGMKKLLNPVANETGMGWLLKEATRQVAEREEFNEESYLERKADLLQGAMDARLPNGAPLSTSDKQSHAFLLIAAGADTTATALGATLRMLLSHPPALSRAQSEIAAADAAGKLSHPIQYEETRAHLPFFVGCIKEALRLWPSAASLLSRVTPPEGKVIDGIFVPGNQEVTSYANVVHRCREVYGDDADEFRPERWLEGEKRTFELEAAQFGFGMGYRSCLGKDIALMELHKVLPEFVRRFDFELLNIGEYVTIGGVGFHQNLTGRLVQKETFA